MTEPRSDVAGQSQMRRMTVMITDMCESSRFTQKFGARAAYEKRKRHNRLLLPAIDLWGGQFVEAVGDSLLAVFDTASDAVHCAVAMQQTLSEYNASAEIDVPDLSIAVRIGLHTGPVLLHRDGNFIEAVGSGVNVAARIEQANERRSDQILLSEPTVRELSDHDNLPLQFLRSLDARGIGHIRCYRMVWQDLPSVREFNNRWTQERKPGNCRYPLLSASTQDSTRRLATGANCCRALFLELGTGQGHVAPISVALEPHPVSRVIGPERSGCIMQAAAARAVQSTLQQLASIGFEQAESDYQVEWWVDGPRAEYDGASIGLAVALATASAIVGVPIKPEIVATGAVDRGQVAAVAGIADKFAVLSDCNDAQQLLLPTGNLAELSAKHDAGYLRLVPVSTIADAIAHVFGATLGLCSEPVAGN